MMFSMMNTTINAEAAECAEASIGLPVNGIQPMNALRSLRTLR